MLTPAEGTATQVAAAFDPSLESTHFTTFQTSNAVTNIVSGSNGAFLENCKPSQIKPEWSWASGKENADKLWTLSEEMVGQKFEY
jgi:hypothetical protein